jgi:hypothetical protein
MPNGGCGLLQPPSSGASSASVVQIFIAES